MRPRLRLLCFEADDEIMPDWLQYSMAVVSAFGKDLLHSQFKFSCLLFKHTTLELFSCYKFLTVNGICL